MEEEEYQSLSIVDRLNHKVWKARCSAYTELHDLFRKSLNDSYFHQYEGHLKAIATDVNAVAQETGLDTIYQYVYNAPDPSSSCDSVVAALVQKCLGASKAGTKQKATEIILLYAEVGMADLVVNLVLPGLEAKQPKLVAQTVMVLRELLRQFGAQVVNPKPLLNVLSKLFGHADKNVRAETFTLTTELHRWIGSAINPSLSSLKPVQIKELEEAFAKLPSDRPTPERLLRSEQQKLSEVVAMDVEIGKSHNGTNGTSEPMEDVYVDTFDLADPVDITAKLPGNFYELLGSKKWQERREALDSLLNSTKTPKIMDNDYTELLKALTKRINDANILLVGVTANCIEGIAIGLRTSFGKYKGLVAPPLIEKLKERKPAILEQVANAVHAVFSSVPIMEIIEDLTVAVKHKNPQIRTQSVKLTIRQLQTRRQIPTKQETAALAEIMLKTMDDADGAAREVSAEGLGTLMKVVGEKVMLAHIDALEDIKKNKINAYYGKAEVKVKATADKKYGVPPKKPVTIQKKVISSFKHVTSSHESMLTSDVPSITTHMSPSKRKPTSQLLGESKNKKPALSTTRLKPTTTTKSSIAAAILPPSNAAEDIKYKFSPEDAESRITNYIPAQIWDDLASGQWKIRLAAMESLHNHLESVLQPADVEAEIVIRCLSKKPGWKEMNFQVMTKLYGVMQLLATTCPSFTRSCVAIGIPGLVEKLGDVKLKKPAADCLGSFAERTSLQFVLSQVYPIWKKTKSPKIMTDALTWAHQALLDFGNAGLQVRDMIDFVKVALSNTNPAVRTNAVTLLVALGMYTGPEILTFVQDVTPALLATIENEFEKKSKSVPPQPIKASSVAPGARRNRSDGGTSGDNGPNHAVTAVLDSLIPRTDISNQLGQTASDCNDANWKKRKEGLDRVVSIIEGAHKRIKPNIGDFPGVLKKRLHDSNKILQIQAIEITGLLVISMGKPFEKYVKTLGGSITSVLSDNKANVRNAGVATLEIIRQTCGLEGLISAFGSSLATDSPVLRKELLTWLSTSMNEPDAYGAKTYYSPLISPLLSCLQDRNADVRKAAQRLLPMMMAATGIDAVLDHMSEMKDTQRQTVAPFVEAARGSALAMISSSAAAAAAEKAKRLSSSPSPSSHATSRSDSADFTGLGNRLNPLKSRTERKKSAGSQGIMSEGTLSIDDTSALMQKVHPPILSSDLRAKLLRAKKEPRWQFDIPQPNMVTALSTACESHIHLETWNLMFSSNQHAERDRLNALDRLCDGIAGPDISMDKYGLDFGEMKKRYLANSDFLFKYLTIRFFDTNTSILLKCLQLAQQLVDIFDSEDAAFSEYEAISFIPFLINKAGDPKETIRIKIRSILRKICAIYPPSKMVNFLLDASTTSKNAKTRIECLEQVGSLIQEYGISVMLPTKALPIIGGHIGDRDAAVRHASLNTIAQAYIIIGDPVFKYVGRLNEVEKGMLEERLKRTKSSLRVPDENEDGQNERQFPDRMDIDDQQPNDTMISPSGSFGITSSPSATPFMQRGNSNTSCDNTKLMEIDDDQNNSFMSNYKDHMIKPAETVGSISMQPSRHQQIQHDPSSQQQCNQQKSNVNMSRYPTPHQHQDRQVQFGQHIIKQITNGDPPSTIDALKQLDKCLKTNPGLILPDIEPLIGAITYQVRVSYSTVDPLNPVTTRLCKHLVNALVLLFSNPELAGSVSQQSIHHLLQELPHPLFDQNILSLESGPQLSKALNVAMLKILENSQRNATFSALLSILASCSAGLRTGDSLAGKETKYTELIMKCLWRLAKTIQGTLKSAALRPDQLLFEINKFFLVTPPSEWKQRLKDDVPLGELPLRTVKTILLEMVNGLGEDVFNCLGLIEDPEHSGVYPYIVHMLESNKKKRETQPRSSYHRYGGSTTTTQTNPANHPSIASSSSPAAFPQSHQRRASPTTPLTHQQDNTTHRSSSHIDSPTVSSSRSHSHYRNSPSGHTPSEVYPLPTVTHSTSMVTDLHGTSSFTSITHQSQPQPMQIDDPSPKALSSDEKPLSETDMASILKHIFEKIGTKDGSKEGIIELYEFQKKYPLAANKVDSYLSQTGSYFQRYIRRGLESLALDDKS